MDSLDLSDNEIRLIEYGAFRDLISLTTLNLSDNVISTISEDIFDGMPRLMSINLSKNPLKDISSKLFRNKSLRRLILSGCSGSKKTSEFTNDTVFELLQSDNFVGLKKVECLYMDDNGSSVLSKKAFRQRGFRFTEELSLNDNRITTFQPGLFRRMKKLQSLHLSGNLISVVENHFFHRLESLEFIDLGKNKIQRIEKDAFFHLKELNDLYLEYNSIKSINNLTFQTTHMDYLNLANNQIKKHIFRKHWCRLDRINGL